MRNPFPVFGVLKINFRELFSFMYAANKRYWNIIKRVYISKLKLHSRANALMKVLSSSA